MKPRSVTFTKLQISDSVQVEPSESWPGDIILNNYPNPFNPTTTIEYRIPSSQYVAIKVLSPLGREIRTLVDGEKRAGWHSASFDAMRYRLSSSLYFITLSTQDWRLVRKMLLTR